MRFLVIGVISNAMGTILLGISVMLTHNRLLKERRIDEDVAKEIRFESVISIIGLILVVNGLTFSLIDLV